MRFVAALLFVGCSTAAPVDAPDTPRGLDAARDVSIDAVTSDAPDALDASDLDAVALDVPPDMGTLDTPADSPGDAGMCRLIPPTGCPDGLACRYQIEDGRRVAVACERAGTARDGEGCETYVDGGDSCLPGYFCSVQCRRYCGGDADCPPLGGRTRVCDPGGLAGRFCVFD